jgi:hypothetical protein
LLMEPECLERFRRVPDLLADAPTNATLIAARLMRPLRDAFAAGGPPTLLELQAASAASPRTVYEWRAVYVAERWPRAQAQRPLTYEQLAAWWDTLSRPYAVAWLREPPGSGRATANCPRRVRLHAPTCGFASGPQAPYRLYQALAAALLRGRCRVCQCPTTARHKVLRVPLCADARCAGQYPVLRAPQAAEALGLDWRQASAALQAVGARRGRRTRKSLRGRRPTRTPLVLQSSVAAAGQAQAGA